MRYPLITVLLFGSISSISVCADEGSGNPILQKKYGNSDLASVVVDTAPGTVSAMSLLGVTADQTSVIENPKGLTLAVKGFDKKSSLGFSITPARTSFTPLDIKDYNESLRSRIWGSTTFSYAQGSSESSGQTYDRRAISIETSFFLEADKDDPLVMYWNAIETASEGDQCWLIPNATKPDSNTSSDGEPVEDTAANGKISAQAKKCREEISKKARWNASKAWISFAGGHYQHESGGDTQSLGNTAVVGGTWGFGETSSSTSAALTAAVKLINDAPTIDSFGNANPTMQSSTLVTMRLAVGSEALRLILEGSDVGDKAPTAPSRVFKSALGIDANISENIWLNFRLGKQRRIDNSGDEYGSSVSLNFSPSALLKL